MLKQVLNPLIKLLLKTRESTETVCKLYFPPTEDFPIKAKNVFRTARLQLTL